MCNGRMLVLQDPTFGNVYILGKWIDSHLTRLSDNDSYMEL